MFKPLMTTATLGVALPSFKEDYPDTKDFDLVGTLSHDFISSTITDI